MATKKKSTNSAFMKPMEVSQQLCEIVGPGPMPRTEVTKLLWKYIKENNLQDPCNKRNICPDEKLCQVFGTNKPINMFEMTKKVSKHLKEAGCADCC